VSGAEGDGVHGTPGQRRCKSLAGWSCGKPLHECIDTRVGVFVTFVGEVQSDQGGVEACVSEGALDEAAGDPGFEERGGVGRPEGRDGDAGFGDAGALCGCTEGARDAGAAHGKSGRRGVLLIPSGGGNEPTLVTVGDPGGASQSQGLCGQGHGTVCGALASLDMHLSALAVDVGDLKGEGVVEPASQARDGGAGDLSMQGGGSLEEAPDFLDTENGGKAVFSVGANQRQGVPVALEDVLREAADAAGAEAHGSWSKAIDVCAVQEGGLQLRFRDHVRGCAIALREHAYCTDRGLLGTFARATAWKCIEHLLAQWGHERSPVLR
jgi:hypothetical protein